MNTGYPSKGLASVYCCVLLVSLLTGCQAMVSSGGGGGNPDRDDDGLSNADEVVRGTDPDNPDTDSDGLLDGEEVELGTSPVAADSDGDRLKDGEDPDPLNPAGDEMEEPPPDEEPVEMEARAEIEPNDTFSTATAAVPTSQGRAQLLGSVSDPGDVDVFSLGPLMAGDTIIVDVAAIDEQLDAVVAIFDNEGRLFIENDNENAELGLFNPSIDEVVRHEGDPYYLAVTHSPDAPATGDYQLDVTVARGGDVPPPAAQTILLDFDGGVTTDPVAGILSIGPFEAGAIDPVYAGQTETVKAVVVDTFHENFATFDVNVFTTDDEPSPDPPFSTVYIGHSDYFSFGIAQAVDIYNGNASDSAVIFVNNFIDDRFGRILTAEELGTAIGNVAAHEMGHLLGLVHVIDPASLMDQDSHPITLVEDQTFNEAPLSPDVFSLGAQDAILLLAEILGLV